MPANLPTPDDLTLPQIFSRFPNEETALEYLEAIRWPNGPVCCHCENSDPAKLWKIAANPAKKIRHGLWQCAIPECKMQFRVTVGTIYEDSHVPLNLWIVATYLLSGAKKGMSALQLKRHLWGDKKGSYKTAWFMAHRIRHAMQETSGTKLEGIVEVDETYVGGKNIGKGHDAALDNKTPVVALVERGGDVRTKVVKRVTGDTLKAAIQENVTRFSEIHTDELQGYRNLQPEYTHKSVNHSAKQYARRENGKLVTSNSAESFFSLLKRGVVGSFHHVSAHHLHRYCDEFSFRWNRRKTTDGARCVDALKGATGKRLTYKPLTKKKK